MQCYYAQSVKYSLYHIHTTYIPHTYHIHTTYIPHTYHIHTTYISHTYHIHTTYISHTYHIHTTIVENIRYFTLKELIGIHLSMLYIGTLI